MNFTMKSRVMPNKSNMNIIDKNKFIHFDHEFYKKTYTDLVEHNITTKEQVLNWVKLQENIDWPTKILKSGPSKGKVRELAACYDMADAYVIGRAHNKI